MTEGVLVLMVNGLMCFGAYQITRPTYILGWLGDWLEANMNPYLYAPLFGCLTCMASVWSLFYFAMFDFTLVYFAYVLALAGLNTLLSVFIQE